jgi:hypothetical protein
MDISTFTQADTSSTREYGGAGRVGHPKRLVNMMEALSR